MSLGKEEVPGCFGKHWDDNAAECAGGRDPAYTDPDTGMHIRERCTFFGSCGARTQAAKQTQRTITPIPTPVPTQIRQLPMVSSTSTVAPPMQMTAAQQQIAQLTQANQLLQRQIQMQQQNPMPSLAFQGNHLQSIQPLQMMAMEMSVPRYLTVPEPRGKGKSIWAMLGREVVRSMFKSTGHTVANFWDQTPIDREE